MTDHPTTTDYRNRAERAEAECKELREALRRIEEGDYPRPVGTQWMPDKPSKHDRCTHGTWMYETCEGCLDSFVRATLGS